MASVATTMPRSSTKPIHFQKVFRDQVYGQRFGETVFAYAASFALIALVLQCEQKTAWRALLVFGTSSLVQLCRRSEVLLRRKKSVVAILFALDFN